jgi:flagellar motility protein MotE (MotC chaperone)
LSRTQRFLALLLIAVAGVLTMRALAGIQALPEAIAGAQAWAEGVAPGAKTAKAKSDAVAALLGKVAATPPPPVSPQAAIVPPPAPAAPVCAPTPAELARQAGMSPAELQVLQSLGARRGQLDDREKSMDTQIALLAAAEGKVDAKLKQLAGLKGDIQDLLGQADAQKQAEVDRLVKVYEGMKPKDAAARLALLDDSVRLPIAAKMKERSLSAVLSQMSPADAKVITEKLADRLASADQARQAIAASAPAPAPVAAASPAPAPTGKKGGKAAASAKG